MPGNERSVTIKISAENLTDAEFKKVQKGLGRIAAESDKTTTKVSTLQRGFQAFGRAAPGALKIVAAGATVASTSVLALGAAVIKLGQMGSELVALKTGFERLTTAAGLTGAEMLRLTTTATKGLISQFDIMEAANKGLLLGLPLTEGSMAKLAESAVVLGRAMGQDASKSLDDLITGLGRASPLILDNLGITVKVGEANELYATKLGKTVTQLTDAEKKTAFYEATLISVSEKVKELGGIQLTFGDIIKQGIVFTKDFRDSLATMIAQSPLLVSGLKAIGEELNKAFGSETKDKALALTQTIEKSTFFVVGLAQAGIKTAGVLTRGFAALKVVFFGVAFSISKVQAVVSETAATALEAASKIPVLGASYKGAAEDARAAADDSAEYTAELKENLRLAAIAAAGNDEYGLSLQSAQVAVDNINTAMVNAGTSQGNLTTKTGEGTAKIKEMGTALGVVNFEMKELTPVMVDWEGKLVETSESARLWEEVVGGAFRNTTTDVDNFGLGVAGVGDLVALETQSMVAAFATFGLKTKAELAKTEDDAKKKFELIKASGELTAEELTKAWAKHEEALRKDAGITQEFRLTSNEALLAGSQRILGVLGQKFKAAAIAGAIISTYQAIAKSLASAPWPFSLVLAAGAAAAGFANVAKIRSSQAGFIHGTPNETFQDFGRATPTVLHGREAVINEAGVPSLAEQIARFQSRMMTRAAPRETDDQLGARLDAIAVGLEALPGTIERSVRDGVLLAV